MAEPILGGIFRTDLEFGSGHIQSPLAVLVNETYAKMQAHKFKKLHGAAVVAVAK